MSPSIGSPAWIIALHRLAVGREQVFLTSLPQAAFLHPAGSVPSAGLRGKVRIKRAEIDAVPHDPKTSTSASIPHWSTVKRLQNSPSCPNSRHSPALLTCGCLHIWQKPSVPGPSPALTLSGAASSSSSTLKWTHGFSFTSLLQD